MKLFSFTHTDYPLPPEGLFGEEWPLQFHRGYSDFYKAYYKNDILFQYYTAQNAWMPFRLMENNMFRFGQILHAPVRNGEETGAEEQSLFFEQMIHFLRDRTNIQRLVQPHPSGIVAAAPSQSKWIPFGTYITHLPKFSDDDSLLASYDPKYRKAIQHSIKNGGRVVFGEACYDDFYTLYEATALRAKIHLDSKAYFIILRTCLGEGHTETGVIYEGDTPIGGIFMMYSKYAAFCTHAGSYQGDSKLYGGMKHLHFEMMKRLRERGVNRYDLVGVRIGSENPALEGIFRFKKGFRGELKQGYLWKQDLQVLSMKIFDMMQKMRNQHTSDIIDQTSEPG